MTLTSMLARSQDQVRMAGPRWLLSNVAVVTARNLKRLFRVPTLIAFATVQPVMFVLLFNYAFGGAIDTPRIDLYIDYALGRLWTPSSSAFSMSRWYEGW